MPSVIPKKIHYIWVGGNIPKGYLENIKHMAALAKRSGFEINLWIDKPKNYQATSDRFDLDIPNLRIRRIEELSDNMLQDPFYDENKRRQFHTCCDMERIGLKNLAAAADLLRYEILREEGGYYIDADTVIDAAGAPLFLEGQYLQEDTTEHGFIFGGDGQMTQSFGPCFDGGNDLIACCPNHPIIERTIDGCLSYYRRAKIVTQTYQLFLASEENKSSDSQELNLMDKKRRHQTKYVTASLSMFYSADRKHLTMLMSGPGMLIEKIEGYCQEHNVSEDTLGEFTFNSKDGNNNPLVKKVAGIFLVSHSDRNWLNKPQLPSAFDDSEMTGFVHSCRTL